MSLNALIEKMNLLAGSLHAKTVRLRAGSHGKYRLGAISAPRVAGYVEDDPLLSATETDWNELIEPENSELDDVMRQIIALLPPEKDGEGVDFSAGDIWVWGGPTPLWGGSMADDTLVRGAEYFGADNVVYVYGAVDDKMLGIHGAYQKLLCQVTDVNRTPEAQLESNEECAEKLSRLSLRYPNIAGGIMDDMGSGQDVPSGERIAPVYRALKKWNPALQMYGVVYTNELAKDFSEVQPYLDVVNLWVWEKQNLLFLDRDIEICRKKFPGKPVLLGVFLHDYGTSDVGMLPELLAFQLNKARHYLAAGWIEGIVILGDREIKKWPESAAALKSLLSCQHHLAGDTRS